MPPDSSVGAGGTNSNSPDAPEIRPGPRGYAARRAMRLVTLAWFFGSVWFIATTGTPLTVFAQTLGASNFQFGLLSALPFLASLTSMPASLLIEHTGRRRRIFLWGLYLQRLMWIPLALVPWFMFRRWGAAAAPGAMVAFLAMFLLMHCGQAIGGPAWTSWMADIVPERLRGTYFSRRRQWGLASGIAAALATGWLMDRYAGNGASTYSILTVCAAIFVVAAAFGTLDIHIFHYVPQVSKAPRRGDHLFRSLGQPLHDRQFILFAGFTALLTFSVALPGQFLTLYVLDKVGINNTGAQAMLLVVPMAAQLLVFPVWGRAVDRMGKKPLMAIAALGLVPAGLGWCLVGSGCPWLGYVLASLGSVLWLGVEMANLDLLLELSGGNSSYIAVNNIIINVAGCLGGFASGLLAQRLEHWHWPLAHFKTLTFYDVLFLLAAALRLLSVALFLPFLHEPEARPAAQALRYISANIYNDLVSVMFQPMRLIARVRRRRE